MDIQGAELVGKTVIVNASDIPNHLGKIDAYDPENFPAYPYFVHLTGNAYAWCAEAELTLSDQSMDEPASVRYGGVFRTGG